MRGNIFNVGLSNANLTKIQLAQLIKNIKGTKIINLKNKKDPDKRDYFVSNKKIERLGFKPNISIEEGIIELKNILKPSILKKIKITTRMSVTHNYSLWRFCKRLVILL